MTTVGNPGQHAKFQAFIAMAEAKLGRPTLAEAALPTIAGSGPR